MRPGTLDGALGGVDSQSASLQSRDCTGQSVQHAITAQQNDPLLHFAVLLVATTATETATDDDADHEEKEQSGGHEDDDDQQIGVVAEVAHKGTQCGAVDAVATSYTSRVRVLAGVASIIVRARA